MKYNALTLIYHMHRRVKALEDGREERWRVGEGRGLDKSDFLACLGLCDAHAKIAI